MRVFYVLHNIKKRAGRYHAIHKPLKQLLRGGKILPEVRSSAFLVQKDLRVIRRIGKTGYAKAIAHKIRLHAARLLTQNGDPIQILPDVHTIVVHTNFLLFFSSLRRTTWQSTAPHHYNTSKNPVLKKGHRHPHTFLAKKHNKYPPFDAQNASDADIYTLYVHIYTNYLRYRPVFPS